MTRVLGRLWALLGLILGAPVWLGTLLYSMLRFRANPFFGQDRIGKNGQVFRLWKVRTYAPGHVPLQEVSVQTRRLSGMRSLGLDEWPQLWHIVQGRMNWIGPRPLPVDYVSVMLETEAIRHQVRPGLIGLAQLRGRNRLTWAQKFRLDRWYVRHQSLRLDLFMWGDFVIHLCQAVWVMGATVPESEQEESPNLLKMRQRTMPELVDQGVR
jgi:sugar transferase EpsL